MDAPSPDPGPSRPARAGPSGPRPRAPGEADGALDALFASAPVGLALYDRDLRYVRVNPVLAAINGHPVEAHLGRAPRDMVPPPLVEEVEACLRRVVTTRAPLLGVEFVASGGDPPVRRRFSVDFFPLLRDGEFDGAGVVVVDVTAQAQAADAFRHASVGIAIGGPDGRTVEACNPAFAVMHGHADPRDVVGRPLAALVAPEDRPRMPGAFAAVDARGTHVLEGTHVRADGTRFPVEVHLSTVRDAAGALRHRVVTVVDLTLRREAEAALRRAEDLLRHAQKLEALGRLAGGVAHDFNNLLTAVLGYCDLSLPRVAGGDVVHEALTQIRRAAVRAGELTGQLLAFSRRQVLQPRVVDLGAVLADLEPLLRRLLPPTITLAVTRAPGVAAVRVDPGQLEQVVVNLVVNARDAMPAGGRVALDVRDVALEEGEASRRGLAPGRYVRLTVVDTGTGMDAETLARAFDPFFTTKRQGTGLGLASVYGIVTQSGGHVRAESAVGQGATFEVLLPRVDGPVDPAPVAAGAPGERVGRETVLLVEDDATIRRLSGDVLRGAGYQVLLAEAGPAAELLAAAHRGPLDLLVSDVMLPGPSGVEVAAALVAARPGLRVLFMSGFTEPERLPAGAPFLPKPFAPEALLAAVRAALDGAPAA